MRQGNVDGTVHPNRTGYRAMSELLRPAVVVGRPAFPYWRATVTIDQVRWPARKSDPVGGTDGTPGARQALAPAAPPVDDTGGPGEEVPEPSGRLTVDFTLHSPREGCASVAGRIIGDHDGDGRCDRGRETAPLPKPVELADRPGVWQTIPHGAMTATLELHAGPRPPRYATAIHGGVGFIGPGPGRGGELPITHVNGDQYRGGAREMEGPYDETTERNGFSVRYHIDVVRISDPREPPVLGDP